MYHFLGEVGDVFLSLKGYLNLFNAALRHFQGDVSLLL